MPVRAKSWDPYLAGDAPESRLDLGLELQLIQLYGQLDPVVGERLDAAVHGGECTGAHRRHDRIPQRPRELFALPPRRRSPLP